MKLIALLLIINGACSSLQSEESWITGTIRDGATAEPLAAAIIRVHGTTRGTVCNSEGVYRLNLPPGTYTFVASCLGYRTDSAVVTVGAIARQDFSLTASAISLPEIVVTGEDPAYAIIRQAIANKKKWLDRLRTYSLDAFTRQVIKRDTAVASITEAFTRGYWQRGDTLREVIVQRRQTANIPESQNFAAVGRLLNFYDDDINFVGYRFVGPIADNAFDYYTYSLTRTRDTGTNEFYEIALSPRSDVVPCFSGTLTIAGGSFALVGVDVEPNKTFSIPFVKEKYLRYRQQFSLYDQTFWLPADIRIDARLAFSIIGLKFPAIGFSQTSVITNYEINIPLPDSVFQKPRLVVDSSARQYDSTLWASPGTLPLTAAEQAAYDSLDSTKTLDIQFRPSGFAATIGAGGSDTSFSPLDLVDIAFNRVEGVHAGVEYSFKKLSPWFAPRAGFAYGFSNKATTYSIGATLYPLGSKQVGVGFDYYRAIISFPGQGYYGPTYNSLTALLFKNDYFDYYRAKGWEAFVSYTPLADLTTRMGFLHEAHDSLPVVTQYSWFSRHRSYRDNPPATEGRLRALLVNLRLGKGPTPFDIVMQNSLDVAVEVSSPHFASSSFDYVRYSTVGSLTFPTFGRRFLFAPNARLRLAAGTSTGTLPPQRMFSLESQSSSFAPFGVMRAMDVKEFGGTRYVALNVEHNFRSLPFLALGLSFLADNNIELIAHAGAARSWNDGPLSVKVTDGVYSEAGFAISRIFELLRCDFTWRLQSTGNFRFCLSAANLL